ncbi:mismatch repair ATPase (MutS family) [Aequorivita sublithincola DSM 14238]|uniref:Mismatch repair ATPase (MutS family) n=1 Tax=Aequorivita sublithincola (strain DSM 14238 / LMG 21431 / ACAM 643 / 9-3) TaxID=746697 RepID=I3YVU0_AEQSU|nr:DNA mismatch repair protein MutS [Aequorivita sublithincola]AFL81108.1 mismatch repair ATPase (MutS family) [Aequorivita sublithincola DSM 14238]
MNKPSDFYKQQIEIHSEDLQKLKKKLAVSSTIRLLVFLLACFGVYFFFGNAKVIIAVIVLTILAFIYLVSKHSGLQYQRDLKKALITQNETELEVLNLAFHHLPSGEKYKDPLHFYSQDIDLFGSGSFFQYLNRTALESGSDFLAKIFTENEINSIPKRQKAIAELSEKPAWRQKFSAIASLVKTEVPATEVTDWLKDYKTFVPKWIKPVSIVFTAISVALIVLNYFDLLSGYVTGGWFILGLAISGKYQKKVNDFSSHTTKIQSTFEQFHRLILEIENERFSSEILSEKRNSVVQSDIKTSTVIKQFARYLDVLEQGNIMIFGTIINGLTLRNLRQSYNIEKWIEEHKESVPVWFESITFFDAYNSLGNFNFNHPNYVFPEINNKVPVLKVKGAGHPLLKESSMIRNDFQINSEEFFIVTGANMAGKSTFLRTVSLQIVMGNIGLPVCAEKAEYNPIKLITSMRTTDSLTDDESYFFSELKRLKFIVDEIKTDRYFIILDEILKGTNSTDKAIGSRKFVEKLVASNSTGIIATHDLSLCVAAEELPEVKNYFFDAIIENDELFFDYTFKPGICQNMNASFLLKKMQIVD